MQYLDALIPLVALAFALSMVSERAAHLFKLYMPSLVHLTGLARWKPYNKTVQVLAELHLQQTDAVYNAIRERTILLISLFFGMVVALLFSRQINEAYALLRQPSKTATERADGTLPPPVDRPPSATAAGGAPPVPAADSSNAPGKADTSKGAQPDEEGGNFVLVLCFGVLLSFGSKVWHDTLDLLLFTKNIKRRWADLDPGEITSSGMLLDYLTTSNHDFVQRAIKENEASLRGRFPGIRLIVPEYRQVDGMKKYCVVIYFETTVPADIVPDLALSGSRQTVRVIAIGGLGPVLPHDQPGSLLMVDDETPAGSFGCLVRKTVASREQFYILTCAHVVTGSRTRLSESQIKSMRFDTSEQKGIGVDDHLFEDGYDFAILGPVDRGLHLNRVRRNRPLQSPIDFSELTINQAIFVSVWRDGEPTVLEGRVKSFEISYSVPVSYHDATVHIVNVVALTNRNGNAPLTEPGDSGSVVYDDANRAIALVIGADNKFTYAQRIIDATNLMGVYIA